MDSVRCFCVNLALFLPLTRLQKMRITFNVGMLLLRAIVVSKRNYTNEIYAQTHTHTSRVFPIHFYLFLTQFLSMISIGLTSRIFAVTVDVSELFLIEFAICIRTCIVCFFLSSIILRHTRNQTSTSISNRPGSAGGQIIKKKNNKYNKLLQFFSLSLFKFYRFIFSYHHQFLLFRLANTAISIAVYVAIFYLFISSIEIAMYFETSQFVSSALLFMDRYYWYFNAMHQSRHTRYN